MLESSSPTTILFGLVITRPTHASDDTVVDHLVAISGHQGAPVDHLGAVIDYLGATTDRRGAIGDRPGDTTNRWGATADY
jgi:hypothetical protein